MPTAQGGKRASKRVSSKDVAKLAGVSQPTVSRVFSNMCNLVTLEKRELVLAAAEELGYRPSSIARSLSTSTTNIIGIIMKHFNVPFFATALELFTQEFQRRGYTTMLFNAKSHDEVDSIVRQALEYQVAGLIITSSTMSFSYADWCIKNELPVFMFHRVGTSCENVNMVCCDNYKAGETIADYLVGRGLDKILYVSGDSDTSTNFDKEKGFVDRLTSLGIKDVLRIDGEFSYASGFLAAQQAIEGKMSFNGVFCSSDSIAMGFYDYIKYRTDLKIPSDISIVGYDDSPETGNINYRLTTYRPPIETMVEATVDNMIELIENHKQTSLKLLFEGGITVRESVR